MVVGEVGLHYVQPAVPVEIDHADAHAALREYCVGDQERKRTWPLMRGIEVNNVDRETPHLTHVELAQLRW